MNINVATWGRLMKRAFPQPCGEPGVYSPPTEKAGKDFFLNFFFLMNLQMFIHFSIEMILLQWFEIHLISLVY